MERKEWQELNERLSALREYAQENIDMSYRFNDEMAADILEATIKVMSTTILKVQVEAQKLLKD